MISRLRGHLLDIDGSVLLIDVGGVGYEVEVSAGVVACGLALGDPMDLVTHFVVREDVQLLYGFVSKAERELFRAFVKINGVGPKMALALISSIDVNTLAHIVATNNVTALTKVPGVGKKTAERLMVELKNRIDSLVTSSTSAVSVVEVGGEPAANGAGVAPNAALEAESALLGLGYKAAEAANAIARAQLELQERGVAADAEALIKHALKSFAQAVPSSS